MLTLRVTYKAQPGTRDAFVSATLESGVLGIIRAEDGCVSYDYYLSVEDADTVVLIEQWESKAQQQAHLQQPHMQTVSDIKDRYIETTTLEEL